MSEKDKANPEQRVTMEERWRAARAACDAGTCDPAEKKFHRAGCMRKIRAEALVVQSETAVADPFYYDPHGLPDMSKYEEGRKKALRELAEGMDVPPEVRDMAAENWGDTPVSYTEPSGIKYGGWIAPSHDVGELYADLPSLEIPEIRVERGGFFYPKAWLAHEIVPVRAHWWSRQWYGVWTRVFGSATSAIFMGEFRTREDAKQQCADLDKLNYEINRYIRKIDKAEQEIADAAC